METTWSRSKVKEILEELKDLPDFDMLLLPEELCKEFNIPMTPARTQHLADYLNAHSKTRLVLLDSYEVRESDGIVREVKGEEPPTLEIVPGIAPLPDQSQEQTKVSIETKHPESPASSSSPPSPHVSEDSSSASVHPCAE